MTRKHRTYQSVNIIIIFT